MKQFLLPVLGLSLFHIAISNGQNIKYSKEHDSLLKIYHTIPNDTAKASLLGKLHLSVLYSDIELAKKYALEQLQLSTKLNYVKRVAFANYNIGGYYKNVGQKDSARYYFEKAKRIFLTSDYPRGEVIANNALAILELAEGNADRALEMINENIKRRISMEDSVGLAKEYNFKGGIYEHKGNFQLAYQYVLKALEIYKKKDQPLDKADALYVLSSLESGFENFEKSKEYSLEALSIYKAQGDTFYEALLTVGIGQDYYNLEAYEDAKNYLLNGLEKAKIIKSPVIEGMALRNLGRTYIKLGKVDEGIRHLKSAVKLNEDNDRPLALLRTLNNISEAYNEIGNPDRAISYMNRAVRLSDSVEAPTLLAAAFEIRSKAWKQKKEYQNALEDYERFKFLEDSIFTVKKNKQIEELRTIYETEKKEQQIAKQEQAIDLLEEKAKVSYLQKLLLGGSIGFLLLLLGFGYYGFRQKIRRNRLEKEKLDAELAFKKKELTTHALHLAKKNEVLESLKQKAEEFKEKEESKKGYQQLIKTINFDLQNDNNWENFARYFEEVHKDFNGNVKAKYPQVTSNELRLLALLKMNLSSKEIANILNISPEGIKKARYRLRKKLDITTEDSLQDLVLSL